mmetsp:Transcript_26674/g.58812  ORF Transcript_26674/g.58812 Transcript_26674/m.58812 type:complete len:306 (-) Transcript_26674:1119-2036(-)
MRDTVHNPGNLVHVHRQLLHQALRHVAKIPNFDETKHSCHFVPRDHNFDPNCAGLGFHQIACQNVSTGITQADVKQRSNAHEGRLQNADLKLAITPTFACGFLATISLVLLLVLHILPLRVFALLLGLLCCTRLQVRTKRILRQLFHQGDHALDGLDHKLLGVAGKLHCTDGQQDDNQGGSYHIVPSLVLHVAPHQDTRSGLQATANRVRRVAILWGKGHQLRLNCPPGAVRIVDGLPTLGVRLPAAMVLGAARAHQALLWAVKGIGRLTGLQSIGTPRRLQLTHRLDPPGNHCGINHNTGRRET